MTQKEKILENLIRLIDEGKIVLNTEDNNWIDHEKFMNWRMKVLTFLNHVYGENSKFYFNFDQNCESTRYASHTLNGLAILKAVKYEIDEGFFLNKLENKIAVDIFADFLEMSDHFLNEDYKDPAAMLIGAVLEDGLRKINLKNDLTLKSDENISSLNQKLADKEIYNRLTQKNVQVWNEIRNNASHAKFDDFTIEDVKNMFQGVSDLLEKYL